MVEQKRLMLIDGYAVVFRAYHALPPMSGPSGEPTNAVLGFANMLLKSIQDLKPDYIIATFDVGHSFRRDEYTEYKANRAESPDDLKAQFQRVRQLLESLGIPIYAKEGYEADDLLGTLSRQASDEGLETIIVTGDTDTFQLISPNVKVLTPRRSIGDTMLYDVEAIRERYGLEPEQLIDLKALTGDTSDNIPGVSGVGIKTATKLLQEHGSVAGIYEHLDEVSPTRYRAALEDGRESAMMSKHLVEIVCDVDVQLDIESARWGHFDRGRVMELLRELGFHSLVGRIPEPETYSGQAQQLGLFGALVEPAEATPAPGEGCEYHLVDSPEALEQLVKRLQKVTRMAVDTETTGTDPMRADMVGLSLSAQTGEAYYLPVGHDKRLNVGRQLPPELVRAKLGPILADARIAKVFHNAKFDLAVLARYGLPVKGLEFDTMIAAWLLDPSGRGLGLKVQAWQRLGIEMIPLEDLIGKGRNQITMAQVSTQKVAPYACGDADMTLRLADVLRPELEQRNQWKLLTDMEIPLIPVLTAMEMYGMVVDSAYLEQMSRELVQRMEELCSQIYAQAGHQFNLNSPKQLGVVLFDELGLPSIKKTATGNSTDVSVMEELQDKHPIVALILEYRQLEKLRGTYIDALPALINPRTGRVHTSFNQTGTSTGRLSSSDPNLQNIPVRTELGRRVRAAFVAPPEKLLLGCDYSQVELRILAHVSKDPELMGAFHRGEDVHAATAAAIFDTPLEYVTPHQRNLAKSINFGLMYGMSDYGLSARTELSVPEARTFIDAYFSRFSRVKEYLDETLRQAQEDGYVETIMGRRRYFPELQSRSAAALRRAAERAAINMPIQGSAADIIKLAMIELDQRLKQSNFQARMVLQVHDELVLEVPERELPDVQALVIDTMENAYQLEVPLKVEVATGKNWMEMK